MNNCKTGRMYCLASVAFAVIILSSFFLPDRAFGRVYIDIDSPGFQKFPIAIVDFKKISQDGSQGDLSGWFSDILGRYLDMTGFFNIISKKAFLEDQKQTGLTVDTIRFPDWSVIGAEYLVKGAFRSTSTNLTAEFYLYDVMKGEVITAKQYTGKAEDRIEMVRKFVGEILSALTGDEGVFNTKIAFVVKKGQTSDVYTINFDGTELSRVTNYQSLTLLPRWSPDAKYISFTSYRSGNPDLYMKATNGAKGEKILNFDGINLAGSWSKDGRRLLLTLSKDGNEEIYVMDYEKRIIKRLTHSFAIDVSPAWSADNGRIAFVSNRSGSPQIFTMDSEGNDIKRVTYDGNYNTSPAWSPRSGRIVYEGRANGRFQIFTINEDGSGKQQLTFENVDHESPSWSPDGRYIVFSTRGGGAYKICVMNANGSNIRTLYENSGGCLTPSWSPQLK
ncbi:MAG TPA: Tol-Pal system beta propeller repeat protein TolB [Syntrophales bacterium]|nr:Tol-Pal system beta propeller repeat protein TolB [Syntrophales bacterium]